MLTDILEIYPTVVVHKLKKGGYSVSSGEVRYMGKRYTGKGHTLTQAIENTLEKIRKAREC